MSRKLCAALLAAAVALALPLSLQGEVAMHAILDRPTCQSCHYYEFNKYLGPNATHEVLLNDLRTRWSWWWANASLPVPTEERMATYGCYTCHLSYQNAPLFALTDYVPFFDNSTAAGYPNETRAFAYSVACWEWGTSEEDVLRPTDTAISVNLTAPSAAAANVTVTVYLLNWMGQNDAIGVEATIVDDVIRPAPFNITAVTRNATGTYALVAGWVNATYAFESDDLRAYSTTAGATQVYGNYSFALPSYAVVKRVEVGVEGYFEVDDQIYVSVSWDGGATWSAAKPGLVNATETLVWLDFTEAVAWTPDMLSNESFLVKVTHANVSATDAVYLDWLPVKVTFEDPSIKVRKLTYSTVIPADGQDQVVWPVKADYFKVEVLTNASVAVSVWTNATEALPEHAWLPRAGAQFPAWIPPAPHKYNVVTDTWECIVGNSGVGNVTLPSSYPTWYHTYGVYSYRRLDNVYDDARLGVAGDPSFVVNATYLFGPEWPDSPATGDVNPVLFERGTTVNLTTSMTCIVEKGLAMGVSGLWELERPYFGHAIPFPASREGREFYACSFCHIERYRP